MPEYLAPGVYVEEVSFRSKSIEGVPTSTTGFAGVARYGPLSFVGGPRTSEPRLITSFTEFERVYGGLVQSFVDVTAHHIETEMEAGRVLPLDAQETARALVWMMERYLNRSLGRVRSDIPRETVATTLTTIWTRVLYGVG